MNSILTISPCQFEGTWVFDDDRVGLVREPFVSGADEIIDRLTEDIPDAAQGLRLTFSAQPFPGYQARLVFDRPEEELRWFSPEEIMGFEKESDRFRNLSYPKLHSSRNT